MRVFIQRLSRLRIQENLTAKVRFFICLPLDLPTLKASSGRRQKSTGTSKGFPSLSKGVHPYSWTGGLLLGTGLHCISSRQRVKTAASNVPKVPGFPVGLMGRLEGSFAPRRRTCSRYGPPVGKTGSAVKNIPWGSPLPKSGAKRAYGVRDIGMLLGSVTPLSIVVMLQALEELDHSILIHVLQLLKLLSYMGCLTTVPADCVAKCQGFSVMHQPWTQAHPPQGGSAYFVAAAL